MSMGNELITVESPDGSVASDQVDTALSGQAGTEDELSDTVASLDADGHIEITELVEDDSNHERWCWARSARFQETADIRNLDLARGNAGLVLSGLLRSQTY
jgi:hypothetical protein